MQPPYMLLTQVIGIARPGAGLKVSAGCEKGISAADDDALTLAEAGVALGERLGLPAAVPY